MRSISHNFVLRILVIIIVLGCMGVSLIGLSQYQAKKAYRDSLIAEVTIKEDRNAVYRNRLDQTIDDDYIIKVAREKLDLHLPEEIVFYNDIQ